MRGGLYRYGIGPDTEAALALVAGFYDRRKVGDAGPLGFRRSTDLGLLTACLPRLLEEGIVAPGGSRFLDLGAADGRVNVLMSYLARVSVGVELDEWTLDEHQSLFHEVSERLRAKRLPLPPRNLYLFQGDSTDPGVHEKILRETGLRFEDFDLFYTYLVMQEEFARMIVERARPGAVFMVYGLGPILPRFEGLKLLEPLSPLEGVLALYRKP